ncbi:hypothetical protein AeRB84_004849 [Aphanomyces euteiches]|nr:hypothetical protein AeRB84_004849 [Aphanomyces euteiches]
MKCGDASHRVVDCPKAAPGEALKLLDAQLKKWHDAVQVVGDMPERCRTRCERHAAFEMQRSVKFTSVTLETACGSLALRVLQAWVDDTSSLIVLIISRPFMEQNAEWDISSEASQILTGQARIQQLMADGRESREPQLDESDGMECATPAVAANRRRKRRRTSQDEKKAARSLTVEETERLESLLSRDVDVFREDLGNDPTLKVEPLKPQGKPDSNPVKCGMRRYSPAHLEYMREHDHMGRCSSKRDTGALRMTIDSRPINACTELMSWPMPNLDSAMACLVGTKACFTLDWTKRYWQLPLHADSQEFFSFMRSFGVYTPTRVLMGQTDAVAYCQSVVHEMLGELLFCGLLEWLGDILDSAKSVASLLDLLNQVTATCAEFGLKLSTKKCHFYSAEAEWCGKIISAAGVTQSPNPRSD